MQLRKKINIFFKNRKRNKSQPGTLCDVQSPCGRVPEKTEKKQRRQKHYRHKQYEH